MGVPKWQVNLPPLKDVPSPNFSERSSKIDLIVLHDTEGGYQGSVSWFQNPKSQVSAHLVLREDGLEATQMVPYGKKAWHCEAFNSRAIGIEMAGFEARGFALKEWIRAARVVGFLCHKFRIPPTWSKGGTKPGVCRHFDLGATGGGHHDPTESTAKWLWFMALVKLNYKWNHYRPDWGK